MYESCTTSLHMFEVQVISLIVYMATLKSNKESGLHLVANLPHYLVEDGIEGFSGGEKGVAGGETSHVEVHRVQLPFGVQSEDGQLIVGSAVLWRQLLRLQVETSGFAVTRVDGSLLSVSANGKGSG